MNNFLVFCDLVVFLPLLQGQIITRNPEVTLSNGRIKGWTLPSKATKGTYLWAFKGIPYATPPIKELRFKAPLSVSNWTEVKVLSQSDPLACAQNQYLSLPSGEDCLFVNVYTPQRVNTKSLLPVMVWIHGGAYAVGSSDSSIYGGDYLVEQGVVFVSLNYRLGALGFLNLGTDAVPGNAGLKDQRLALQWVQKEIVNFGGDPKKVTIFGQSAGAASVILQYISPNSAGLFRSAIAESGNALAEWSFMATGFEERAKALSDKLNCTDKNATISLSCLQNANISDIITYQELPLTDNEYIPGNRFVFVPTLEKPSDDAVLSETPENLLTALLKSNGSKVPLITGVCKDEGLGEIQSNESYYQQLPSKLKYFIPKSIRDKKTTAQIEQDVASIYSEYFQNTPPSLTNLDGFIKIYTDKMFALSIAVFAREIENHTDTYLYHFDYDGKFKQQHTPAMEMNITKGVHHGDEMGYLFVREEIDQMNTSENTTEKRTLRKMVKLWTNFAKYGNPTPSDNASDSVLSNFTWNPISDDSIHYMRVTADLFEMSSDDFLERSVSFWSKIESITSLGSKTSLSILLLTVFVFLNLLF